MVSMPAYANELLPSRSAHFGDSGRYLMPRISTVYKLPRCMNIRACMASATSAHAALRGALSRSPVDATGREWPCESLHDHGCTAVGELA